MVYAADGSVIGRLKEKRERKRRGLSQVVSPASPTYLHNLALSPHEIGYLTPPPMLALGHAASGFTLVQADVDARAYRVHRRLSRAALRALLAATPHAPPLLLHGSVPSHLPFLPRGQGALSPLRGSASPLVDSAVHPA